MTRYLLINGKRYEIDYDASTGNYEIGPEASLPQDAIIAQYPELVDVDKDLYSGSDTNISIEEIYNQLSLTAEQTEIEDLVQSPLSDENMFSPFSNSVPYCIELASFGEGERALKGYIDLLKNFKSTYEGAVTYKHYVQLYKNSQWRFNGDKYIDENSTDQLRVLRLARGNTCTAFLAAFGNTQAQSEKDNTISGKVDMKRYLVIAINGNRTDNVDTCYPSEEDIQNAAPIATYTGGLAGGFLSPTDNETVNYLVISGKFICTSSLQHSTPMRDSAVTDNIIDISWDEYGNEIKQYAPEPNAGQIMDYPSLLEYANQGYSTMYSRFWHKTCNLDESKNSDGAYYTTAFYEQNGTVRTTKNAESLYPYNSDWKSLNELEYNYSQNWDNSDKLWKLDLIQCTLKIGDKYCVEIPNVDGLPTYRWLRYEDCPVIAGVVQNHIFLGPNPKIGDSFIGVEYDMCNTVDHTMNIDAKGIAIPILADDILSGKVEFTIDGPCNLTYDEITRHHPSFWKHTEWGVKSQQVLGHINQIMISDFEVKIYSNNANINNAEGNEDLIYQSDETLSDFVNRKDDITFKITTNLTSKECKEKGIRNTVKMNTAWLNNAPLRSVYNVYTQNEGKPEEHYLTNYFREYTAPKVLIETELFEDAQHDFISHYAFRNMQGKEFMVQSITKDVKNATDTLLLKEIPTTYQPEDLYPVETPVITQNGFDVSIECDTEDVTIYYSFNGTPVPGEGFTYVYSEPISMSFQILTSTVKAIAVHNEYHSVSSVATYVYTRPQLEKTEKPVIDINGNIMTITCETQMSQIFYKIDDESYTQYLEPVTLTDDCNISAYAVGYHMADSDISYAVYTKPVVLTVSTPVININDKILTITCDTPEATIYYKIDNGSYTQYTSAVTLNDSCQITAYAVKSGWNDSDTAVNNYQATTATPVVVLNGNILTATCDTSGATIWYKIDNGSYTRYTGPVTLTDTCTVNVYAHKIYWISSSTVEVIYVKAPTIRLDNNKVYLDYTAGTGITAYYTLDGTEPTTSSTQYSSYFTINKNNDYTIKAITVYKNTSSAVTVYEYISLKAPTITQQYYTLSMSTPTPDASIYYRFDQFGITTQNSSLYTEPFILAEYKQYIQAKAYQASTNSWSDSSTLSYYHPYVPVPELTRSGNTITLTDTLGDASLYVDILRNGQYSGFDYTGPFTLDYSCTIYPYLHKNVNGNDMWSDDTPYEFVPV